MNESASIAELQAIKLQLVESLHVLESPQRVELLPALESAEDSFIREITHNPDFHPRAGYCVESADALNALIERSADAEKAVLLNQIELLRRVKETGREQASRTPWGTVEVIYPIRLVGRTVYALQTGPLKVGDFTDEERAALENVVGYLSDEDLARFPVFTESEGDRILRMYRAMACHIEQALTYHVRARDLTEQVVQSERTRSLGTLSSGISHHFNGLLSIILGYSSFILNREEPVSKESEEALHSITEAAQRGRRLTEELLSFAGSEAEEEAVAGLHGSLENVLSLLESQYSSHIRFERNFEALKDSVLALPSDIHQMVFNLLTLAIDGLEESNCIRVSTSNRTLDPESTAQEYLLIQVDSGRETDDDTEALTEGLSQLKESGEQHEMPLASLYGMVRRMEGTAMIGSKTNPVSRIELLLPVAAPAHEIIEERKVKPRRVSSRIWVVDDDPLFREMCVQVLEEEGHEIVECGDAGELQSQWEAADHPPDLVIVDFSMPEYNGLELRQWIKSQNSRIPVVLVSGLAPNQPDIKKALKMKKTYFLQKPFSFRELSDIASIAMGETLLGE